ncbi:MAG: hypothetical protein RLZZ621_2252 [Gemmatimonadota bacterium]|jgi:hypothetical protein
MPTMLTQLFPETLFPRRLTPENAQRLRLAAARADEAIVRTHIDNALRFVDLLAAEIGFERAIDLYLRELAIPEPLASVVATRTLVVLGDSLMLPIEDDKTNGTAEAVPLPELRLDEAARRRRA